MQFQTGYGNGFSSTPLYQVLIALSLEFVMCQVSKTSLDRYSYPIQDFSIRVTRL